MTPHLPSELAMDRYLLGEATPEEAQMVKEWLAADAAAETLLARRKNQADTAVAAVPAFDDLARTVESRRGERGAAIRRFPMLRTGFATAAASLIAAGLVLFFRPADTWTPKGGAPSCIIKHGSKVARAHGSAPCTIGDTVQLYHDVQGAPWVMALFSERGGAFLPCAKSDSAFHMESSSLPAPLPFSIVIDTAKGVLDLAVAVSTHPFTAREAINSLIGKSRGNLHITRFSLVRE